MEFRAHTNIKKLNTLLCQRIQGILLKKLKRHTYDVYTVIVTVDYYQPLVSVNATLFVNNNIG